MFLAIHCFCFTLMQDQFSVVDCHERLFVDLHASANTDSEAFYER